MNSALAAESLLTKVLAWDYWEITEKLETSGGMFDNLRSVPLTFKSMEEYKQVFEPLVLEECCAQILRGMEEGEVLEPHKAVSAAFEERGDFSFTTMVVEAETSQSYSDNDLILISRDDPFGDDPNATMHSLGMVESHFGSQGLMIKCLLTDECQTQAGGIKRVRSMKSGLQIKASPWFLLKLTNMSTITREWVALQHAHLCPFADILLSGRPKVEQHESRHLDIPPGMKETMERQCNMSQMDALQAGLDGTPVVLIQGPPGTGKTRTILNLLSVVMHSASKGSLIVQKPAAKALSDGDEVGGMNQEDKFRLWSKQAPWAFSQQDAREEAKARHMSLCHFPPPLQREAGWGINCFGLLDNAPPTRLSQNIGPKAHVLVCAPSNSALDEIVMRTLNTGLMDKDGRMYSPSLVRIGVNVHHSVRSLSLEAMVDSRLGVGGGGEGGGDRRGGRKGQIGNNFERDQMRRAILDDAAIVCSTLSFAGTSMFQRLGRKFDVVIIDEAAQAVEPSLLVPLVMGCKQVYLVGDPVQLPATVISRRAIEFNYDNSMFKRLQAAGYPVKILDTQYRMHPDISHFPSDHFYGSKLLNGEDVANQTKRPWHSHRCFGPFAFYDVQGKESSPPGSSSIQNRAEAQMVLCVYRELLNRYPSLRGTPSVGIISPYKSQVKLLKDSFEQALGAEGARLVDINTIDGFQGREKDIILFSCVRSVRGKGGIGFVADERRINVGLTRARCSLIVIGNAKALQCNSNWAGVIKEALTKGALFRPSSPQQYNQWMNDVVDQKIEAVSPDEAELAPLDQSIDNTLQEGGLNASSMEEVALDQTTTKKIKIK